jgi:aspartate racemase
LVLYWFCRLGYSIARKKRSPTNLLIYTQYLSFWSRIDMQTIGLIGGMSWESTVAYYQIINQTVKQKLGGLHSAKIVVFSVDFDEIQRAQQAGDWAGAAQLVGQAANALRLAGADFFLIGANTMHKVADEVQAAAGIPLLHVVDALAAEIKQRQGGKVGGKIGLLGTRYTMEQDFYRARLSANGIDSVIPNLADRNTVHRVIYEELCLGQVNDQSRFAYREIMQRMIDDGAQGIVLGCTEIAMLVGQADCPVPVFDTTEIHARAAVAYALAKR